MAAAAKRYTEESLLGMDKKANKAVMAMTGAGVGVGFVPVMVDVAVLMAAMGGGVVSIGTCYDMRLTKEDAAELIKEFFKAAGMTFSMVFAGQKITASILKSNPVTYVPTMIADAAMCGTIAFAVGETSKKYFRRLASGKTVSKNDMKKWMTEGKKNGKSIAKEYAEQQAKDIGK